MKKITLLIFALVGFMWQSNAQSTINITTSGGDFGTEKWVSVTTEANGAGTQVFGQGDGTYGNGAGFIDQEINLAPGTYYVNCYDKYGDGWDGTLISVTAYNQVLADNGGDSPNDGTDTDSSSAFGDTQAQELEASLMIVVPEAPTCSQATVASAVVVADCDNDQFSVMVDVLTQGDATEITDGTDTYPITGAGVVSVGPFTAGSLVDLTIIHSDTACNLPLGNFTFNCPPENTSCADATLLACEQTVNGTTDGSTGTSEGVGCSMGNNGVWFTFKGTGGDITINSTASFDHEMGITKGACGDLTNIACIDLSVGAETYTLALTTLDQDYYVYLARFNAGSTATGTYSITIECATAPDCTQATVGSSTIVNDCAASQFSVDIDITSLGNAVEISNGTDSYPITGTGIVTAGPFDFGTSQTLTVVHDDMACNVALGSFTVAACPPANDNCSGAIELTAGADLTCANPVSGSTIGATQSLPGCAGTANDDVWYYFEATGVQNSIIITNTGGSSDIVTEVFDACGGTSLKCQDTPNSPVNLTGLTTGNMYYFRVYTYSATASTTTNFDVCVGTPPPPPANDECSGAELLTVEGNVPDLASATQIPGTIANATDSGVADSVGTANDDVWFTFVAKSTQINIDVTDNFDGVVELFSGACGTLTSIEYDDFDGPSSNPSISRTDFNVDETYYVRVYNYSSTTTGTPTFNIALWTSGTLSVNSFTDNNFTYFPNPVNNTLNLKAKNAIQNVSIYNMLGQEVAKISPNALDSEVDMSALQTGAYFVKVTINDATETIRVIKQ